MALKADDLQGRPARIADWTGSYYAEHRADAGAPSLETDSA